MSTDYGVMQKQIATAIRKKVLAENIVEKQQQYIPGTVNRMYGGLLTDFMW